MPDSTIVLIATVKGAHNIARGNSLHFNIDGDFVNLGSIDDLTDIETESGFYGSGLYIPASNWSSKRYLTTKQFVKRLISADEVWVRIDLTKEFVDRD